MRLAKPLIALAACLAACNSGRTGAALAQTTAAAVSPPQLTICQVVESNVPLPPDVRETSGLARSILDPGRFWTHNDAGNGPELFALDERGRLIERVRVAGANMVDWEDIAVAPCSSGSCLFIADIGDNDGERDEVIIYRVPEPAAGATETISAIAMRARFPDGARDAEGLFLDRSGNLYIVNKGRRENIALYRYAAPHRADETVTLERVRDLFPQPSDDQDLVTAAASTPDGRWIGIRTYRTLYLYRADDLFSGDVALQPIVADLSAIGEAQGESLTLGDDGAVWISSEAENSGTQARWARLQCSLP